MNNTTEPVDLVDPRFLAFQEFIAEYLRTLPYWVVFRTTIFAFAFPAYLLILMVFIKNKFYTKSSFFVMSISLGIADLLNMCGRISTFCIPAIGVLLYGQVQEIYRGSAVISYFEMQITVFRFSVSLTCSPCTVRQQHKCMASYS
jgi:hypothetical protein